jgi:hypothetical protein
MNRLLPSALLAALLVVAIGTAGYEFARTGLLQIRAAGVPAPAVVVQAPAAITADKRDSLQLLEAGIPRALAGPVPVAQDLSAEISETGSGHGDRQLQVLLHRGDPGIAIDGANVIADGTMVSMGHDSFRVGSTALGDGAYLLTLPFTMDGQWDVILTITAGAIRGNVSLSIDVGAAS